MAEVAAFRNNALPYPVWGVSFTVVIPILDADGDVVTSATGLDSEISKNGDTPADCTNEATEIGSSGQYYLTLTGTEMQADIISGVTKTSSSGAKTTCWTLYPRKLVAIATGTCQGSNDTGDIQLASGDSPVDDYYNGCLCVATIDTVVEARIINDYVGSTKVGEVSPAWSTAQPDSNDTYTIYLPEGRQVSKADVVAANNVAITTTGAVDANVTQISGDSTAADNCELFFDGTGYVGGTAKLAVNTAQINGVTAATPGAAGGVFIAGANAATSISNASGAALTLSSSGSNGSALLALGNGSGAGFTLSGGATGAGLAILGGGTSGDAVALTATDGDGIDIRGGGTTNHGMRLARGGSSGDDLKFANDDCTIPVTTSVTSITGLSPVRRTLWVTKAGNDSNNGFDFSTAKLTIAGAVAIARNGDAIWIGDGTYSEQVDLATATLKNITLIGQSKSGVIITATVTSFFGVIQGYEGTWVKNMTVTTATNNGTGITFLDHSNCGMEDVDVTGVWDAVLNGKLSSTIPYGFVARRCKFTSKGDVLNLSGNRGFLVEDCYLVTDSTGISIPLAGSEPTNCILAQSGAIGTVRNSGLVLTRGSAYNGLTHKSAGIIAGGAGGHVTVEGSTISVTATGASDGGDIRGIASHYTSPEELHVRLVNTEVITTKTYASQNAYDIDASTSGSKVSYVNSRIDQDKLNGTANVTPDLTIYTENGSDTVGNQLEYLDAAISSAVSAGTVSAFLVPKGHSWKFDSPTQTTAANSVYEVTGFDDTLFEMDLTGVLNANASISSITSVSIANITGTEPTVVSSAKRADAKAIHIKLDGASATATTFTVSATYVTTDGQTQTRKGRLVVQ